MTQTICPACGAHAIPDREALIELAVRRLADERMSGNDGDWKDLTAGDCARIVVDALLEELAA